MVRWWRWQYINSHFVRDARHSAPSNQASGWAKQWQTAIGIVLLPCLVCILRRLCLISVRAMFAIISLLALWSLSDICVEEVMLMYLDIQHTAYISIDISIWKFKRNAHLSQCQSKYSAGWNFCSRTHRRNVGCHTRAYFAIFAFHIFSLYVVVVFFSSSSVSISPSRRASFIHHIHVI